MNRRLPRRDRSLSPKRMGSDESHVQEMLARFGPNAHTFNDEDRRKAVEARRKKAAERRDKAQTLPEYARTQIERDPASWFEPYEQARRAGDWKAVEALQDRAYGRPVPTAVSQDFGEIEPGDAVEIRRLLLERISVEHAGKAAPADGPPDEL